MKYALSLTPLFLILVSPSFTQAQLEIGQTKEYIINKHSDCYIESNEDDHIIIDCHGLKSLYMFDEPNKLCGFIGTELNDESLEGLIKTLKNEGYQSEGRLQAPIFLTSKNESTQASSPAVMLQNDTYLITILDYDLEGNDSSGKFCMYIERSKSNE